MTPTRFRLKVADHMGQHGKMGEVRAINEVASILGWLDQGGSPSEQAPVWLYRYRELVAFRDLNLSMAATAQGRAADCAAKLEALSDAHT